MHEDEQDISTKNVAQSGEVYLEETERTDMERGDNEDGSENGKQGMDLSAFLKYSNQSRTP